MLDEFEKWFGRKRLQATQPFQVTITKSPEGIDKRSVYADIESASVIARAVLWDTNEYEEEALDTETGETLFDNYMLLRNLEDLHEQLNAFVSRVSLYRRSRGSD